MGSNPACPTIARSLLRGAVLALLLGGGAAAQMPPFEMDSPIRCPAGQRCPIEVQVDHDPGPGIRDFACGTVTYDGHGGIDIRVQDLLSVAQGVPVVADTETDAGSAYADMVARFLGEERAHRFVEVEKKGFLGRLFGT